MEMSPCSEAKSNSASQEIHQILWYLKVHYTEGPHWFLS